MSSTSLPARRVSIQGTADLAFVGDQRRPLGAPKARLDQPWVLDIDASIKPLYGRQEGAEIGYNPTKPMRPNHVLHTFLVANLRLVLDELGERRAALVRGDCGYGNEGTKNVQRLVAQQFSRDDWSRPDNPGCQMVRAQLQLHGWSAKRRVVIVRQRRIDHRQLRLDLAGPSVCEGDRFWAYAVLVTDVGYPLESIAQLYRDRADAENAFDELKNQWGLGGFTTQDINRCQTVARVCALVYNGWSWYCRAAHPQGRLEAITSRPLMLAAVGKAATHASQTTLYLTPLHRRADVLKRLLVNIGPALQHVKAAAKQFKDLDRWACLLRYISEQIAAEIGPPKPAVGLLTTA